MATIIANPALGDVPCAPAVGVKRRTRKRLVRFSKNARVIRLRPFPENIQRDLFFNLEDFKIMRTRDRLLVNMVREGRFTETVERTIRGLEPHFEAVLNKQRRTRSVSAVMEEQNRQRRKGEKRPELIRKAYRTVTTTSTNIARLVGQQDEQEVMKFRRLAQKEYTLADLKTGDDVCSTAETDETSEASNFVPDAPPPDIVLDTPRMRQKKGMFRRWSSRKLLGKRETSWRGNKKSVSDNAQAELSQDKLMLQMDRKTSERRLLPTQGEEPQAANPVQTEKKNGSIRNMGKLLKSWSNKKLGSKSQRASEAECPPREIEDVHFTGGDAASVAPLSPGKKSSSLRNMRNMLKTWSSKKLGSQNPRSSEEEADSQMPAAPREIKDINFNGGAMSRPPLSPSKKTNSLRDVRQVFKSFSKKKLLSQSFRLPSSPEKEPTTPRQEISVSRYSPKRWSQRNLLDDELPANIKKTDINFQHDNEEADPILPPPGNDAGLRDMLRGWSTKSLRTKSSWGVDPEDCKSPESRKISAADFAGRGRVFRSQEPSTITPIQPRKKLTIKKKRTWSTDIVLGGQLEDSETSQTSKHDEQTEIYLSPRGLANGIPRTPNSANSGKGKSKSMRNMLRSLSKTRLVSPLPRQNSLSSTRS